MASSNYISTYFVEIQQNTQYFEQSIVRNTLFKNNFFFIKYLTSQAYIFTIKFATENKT